ncbi:hypothetical protein QIW53_01700 [Pseudomonas fluorescens]|uniref:hypothetical protein n=1 Tax=Pseudomonas fluorescens TaxID=294 RepID=UPI0035264B94
MAAQIVKRHAEGTIRAIRHVRVDDMPTKFAMVMPNDGYPTMAVRIGLNITAEGDDYFLVGDRVRYTVLMDGAGAFPKAQDLQKFTNDRQRS